MEASAKRKWLAFSLMAVVLPMGLLVAFKLTGIIPDPPTPEIIICKPVSFEMERPTNSLEFDGRTENTYADGEATARMGVYVSSYRENCLTMPYADREGLSFTVHTNFSALRGSGVSLAITYLPTEENAAVYVGSSFMVQRNVSVTELKWFGVNVSEAYTKAEILNSPCYLRAQAHWVFNDENTAEHQLNVTVEITHFNGTAYRKIVLPARLYLWTDAGDSFEEAKHIDVGNYTGFLGRSMPPPGHNDLEDYYKLRIEEDQTISVRMQHKTSTNFDLHLYNFNTDLLASSCSEEPEVAESVIFKAEASGWYYIEVSVVSGFGLYILEVVS